MKFPRLAVLTLAMLIGPGRALAEEAKKDLEKLQGDWDLVSAETKSKDITNVAKKNFSMKIKGNKFVLETGGNLLEFIFRLNSAKSPKEVDFKTAAGGTALGIFAFDGDKLKLSWLPNGKGRPKGFTTDAKTNQYTFVVKRKKR
jgi:uncharacterized protein (TIGR03067 family)